MIQYNNFRFTLTTLLKTFNFRFFTDGWIKLNTNLVCFGARHNRFGNSLFRSAAN